MQGLELTVADTPPDEKDWQPAIMAEREREPSHRIMKRAVLLLEGPRRDALVLGDASLVQSRYLIEEASFARVADVDSNQMLLDDFYQDARLQKILSRFEDYQPPEDSFDVIYGKSIAFYPKRHIVEYLQKLSAALRSHGLFAAEWALEGDEFRDETYTLEEVEDMHAAAGFKIVETATEPAYKTKGLVRPGVGHTVRMIAKHANTV